MADGLLTQFQAEQLLAGRWRNFVMGGKYKILERIGAVGSSAVFLAEHLVMQRLVALKVLPTTHAENPEVLTRFLREARAAALLDHPNVARLYDVDRAGESQFLVMEFIHGPDLDTLVRSRGRLEPWQAADYARQAAVALQHAHEAGLVHRDVKPGNLLVDSSGTVKILDLGLVRIFQSDDGLTKGQNFRYVLGTLDYQAPEQAVDSHEVDIRADIYSLGATLYCFLTGGPVFPDGTVAEKISWHLARRPRPITQIRDDVPAGLAAVVDRMLAKAPKDRYGEPAEVAEVLAEWARGPAPPKDAEMPELSRAARSLLDARPRPKAWPSGSDARRVDAPATNGTKDALPVTFVAPPPLPPVQESGPAPSPTASPTSAVPPPRSRSTGQRTVARRLRPRRRAILVAAATGVLALAGARHYGLVSVPKAGAPDAKKASSTQKRGINLYDSVAALNSQIEAESRPAIKARLHVRRANLYGRFGRWKQAADDFATAESLDPTDQWTWYGAAPVLAEIGDRDAYRQHGREMLRRFESSTDALFFERVAKLWLLTPDCPGDAAAMTKLIDRASVAEASHPLYHWVLSTKGIAEYRAGRAAEAVTWLEMASDATPSKTPQCKALSGLFLAMALVRQGRQAQSRQAYDRALDVLNEYELQQFGGDLGPEWGDWLMCQIVRREAERELGLIK